MWTIRLNYPTKSVKKHYTGNRIVSPFLWSGSDSKPHTYTLLFLPLFYYTRSSGFVAEQINQEKKWNPASLILSRGKTGCYKEGWWWIVISLSWRKNSHFPRGQIEILQREYKRNPAHCNCRSPFVLQSTGSFLCSKKHFACNYTTLSFYAMRRRYLHSVCTKGDHVSLENDMFSISFAHKKLFFRFASNVAWEILNGLTI